MARLDSSPRCALRCRNRTADLNASAHSTHEQQTTCGDKYRLKRVDFRDTLNLQAENEPRAEDALAQSVETLAGLHDLL